MNGMSGVSEWFTRIPGSYLYVRAPSWWWIAIYYGALIVALSDWVKTPPGKKLATVATVLLAVIGFGQWEKSRANTELTVLPLNGGHAIFVDGSGRNNEWLIDCGNADAVTFTLTPFLRAQGVNQIPRLVLTEGDAKNCGGATTLEQDFSISQLWTSPVHFRSGVYNKIIESFEKPSSRHQTFNYGDTNACWRVLWPSGTNDLSRADDNALVLLGNFSGTKVLLLSDLSLAGQSALLAATNDLHADIVIAGLPTQGEPLGDALADAIHPSVMVIADSDYPPMRRASRKLKERLEQKDIPTIYTRDSGAVKIVINKTGWKLSAMDGEKFSSGQ
jgi:beta-lactamase superfamily II metal-dependent hydrolase